MAYTHPWTLMREEQMASRGDRSGGSFGGGGRGGRGGMNLPPGSPEYGTPEFWEAVKEYKKTGKWPTTKPTTPAAPTGQQRYDEMVAKGWLQPPPQVPDYNVNMPDYGAQLADWTQSFNRFFGPQAGYDPNTGTPGWLQGAMSQPNPVRMAPVVQQPAAPSIMGAPWSAAPPVTPLPGQPPVT